MKPIDPKSVKLADSEEVESREREIQLLFNIIEPDPDLQPVFASDEASIMDCTGEDEKLILARLEFYFKFDCHFALSMPMWTVDELRQRIPGWPDDWEPTLQ